MPEGPEVRRYADALQTALGGKRLIQVTARTRAARAWLTERPGVFEGCRVERVVSRGKNLIGYVEGGLFFYAHLLMWGSWTFQRPAPDTIDRRERARLIAEDKTAVILLSAPVFEVGEGDPLRDNPYLRALGPDILPEAGPQAFASGCFRERLTTPENRARSIGADLLDQTIVAGLGNYLRAELLFLCRIDPFRLVADLTVEELACLTKTIPLLARRAYETGGVTVTETDHERLRTEPGLAYPNTVSDFGRRHYVFRRTNLPCLNCGTLIRQRRQVTHTTEEGEDKERIIYFCPVCQGVGEVSR